MADLQNYKPLISAMITPERSGLIDYLMDYYPHINTMTGHHQQKLKTV